ncbi:maltose acetyltransferase domain-containing protein [Paenibacillus sp. SAF-068]|uniref:maltose acetyltransferase domain-containing protein n=1 Tax=Paenibacillus sp. SAF-068 TaxID=3436864 RepID=UPI003F81539A
MTEKETLHAGLMYQPSDPELAADRDVTVKKLHDYNNLHPLERNLRYSVIIELFGKVGQNCVVEQQLFWTYGYKTKLGNNCFINLNCKLMDSEIITIGDNVFIAPNVCIIMENHAMDVDTVVLYNSISKFE